MKNTKTTKIVLICTALLIFALLTIAFNLSAVTSFLLAVSPVIAGKGKSKKAPEQNDLFTDLTSSFEQDELTAILQKAKADKEKARAKNELFNATANGIVFMQAKQSPIANTNGFFNDKPEIYTLHYVYAKKGKNGTTQEVTAETKRIDFWKEIARMSEGSELATVINNTITATE